MAGARPLGGWFALAFSSLLVWQAPTQAQPSTPITGGSRVEQDSRPAPQPLRRDAIRIDAPRFAEQVPPGAGEVTFTLGLVVVSGYSRLPTEGLSALWSQYIGRRITLAQAFDIAAGVSAYYRNAGFVLSQAVVPAQDLPTDTPAMLRIQVLEGFVDRVRFTGLPQAAGQPFMAEVLAERPLSLSTLERALLLLSEQPGLRAQANLSAGVAPNATQVEVLVEQDRTAGSLTLHNRTAPSQGSLRIEATGEWRGLLGHFDRHVLRWSGSGDSRLNLLAYSADAPLGADGWRAQWSASSTSSKPTTTVTNFENDSRNLALGVAHAAQRSRRANLTLRASLNGYDNRSETLAGTVSEDHIRAVRLGLTGDLSDAFGGITLLDLEFGKGLTGLGASQKGDPLLLGADPAFRRTTAYLARLQGLGAGASLLLAHTQQWSNSKLPSAEQLGLGGELFLRAYDPSEAIGEEGHASKVELRWETGPVGTRWPVSLTLYGYYDQGAVERRQVTGPSTSTRLKAAGTGVRFSAPRGLRGYLELAKPLGPPVASQGNDDLRVFAGLGIDF